MKNRMRQPPSTGNRYLSDAAWARAKLPLRSEIQSSLFQRLKRTLIVWLAVYPSALVVLSLVGNILQDWPPYLGVLGSTLLIVPIVANITEPAVRKAFTALEQAWAQRPSRPHD